MSFLKDQSKNTPTDQDPPTPLCIKMAASTLSEKFDGRYGGFGTLPKFPQPGELYRYMYIHVLIVLSWILVQLTIAQSPL